PASPEHNALKLASFNPGVSSSKYDIVLFLQEGRAGLATAWVYRNDLFEAATVRAMASDFEAVARTVVEAPETTLSELRRLLRSLAERRSEEERDQRRLANRALLRGSFAGSGKRSEA